ncbi:MAG TPA: NHL repeat-containing protein [Candidatus Tumulicola sp.]
MPANVSRSPAQSSARGARAEQDAAADGRNRTSKEGEIMYSSRTWVFGSLSALVLAACSATSPPPVLQSLPQGRQITASVRADVRFGLTAAHIAASRAARGPGYERAAKTKPTLFVSDIDSDMIRLFPANQKNPTQDGSITSGIDLPVNDAVDKQGTLYVANNGNSSVTEYPLGQTSPSVTLSGGMLVFPNGIAVGKTGTVYVTSGAYAGQCYVLVYTKGKSSPKAQINGFDLPVGLALDKNGNLYVGDAIANKVWKVTKGSTTPTDLGLNGLSDPTGVAIDRNNDLWVANDQNNTALGFHLGQTSAFATITSGLQGPYSIAFGASGRLFIGNSLHYPGSVAGFKKGATSPYESISVANPAGVAVHPRPNP